MKLSFKENCERLFRRYVLLRLRNRAFVMTWLTVMFAEICAANKIAVTTDMAWVDIPGMIVHIFCNPVQIITLIGITLVSFINPLSRGYSDKDFEFVDPRLKELEDKSNKPFTPQSSTPPPIIIREPEGQQSPRKSSIVEINILKK